MAKLNWEKLNQQSKAQSFNENSPSVYPTKQFFMNSGIWAMQGKYFGTKVTKLPLEYLCWIIDNKLEPNNKPHRDIAEAELYRRYNELT